LLACLEDRRAIPVLLAALKDEDPAVRTKAASAFSYMPDQRATEPLIYLLGDKDNEVVASAARALGPIGDRRAIEPLIALFVKQRDKGIAEAAGDSLGKLGGPRAFEVLLAAHNSGKPGGSAVNLGATKDPRAFEVLRKILDSKAPARERVSAVQGLGHLGDARSIALLKPLLENERPKDWFEKCRTEVPAVRPATARALVGTGDAGAIEAVYREFKNSPKIVKYQFTDTSDGHFRQAAVDAFATSPEPSTYLKVIDALQWSELSVCREATRILNCSTHWLWMDEGSMTPMYRRRKLEALRDERVLRSLMKLVETMPSPGANAAMAKTLNEVRQNAVWALSKSESPLALKFLDEMEAKAARTSADDNSDGGN
jgi:HEAT repeat protein